MDSSQIESLVQRLVSHPHDEEALARAHQSGASDPKSYALLLERVGAETRDPAYASHWLSEAANVWSLTLGDAHRAARVLMQAIDRDPTQRVASDRLSQMYRDKGDVKALVALLERRAKALAPLASQSSEIRAELAAMHEELGRLWSESLHQAKKAVENYRRAIDLAPSSLLAIDGAREIYKSVGQWDEAIRMSDAELALQRDPQRQLAVLRDQAAMYRAAGDRAGATEALARARQLDDRDPALQQEYGGLIVERIAAGEDVPAKERTTGAELLVGLAEVYDGEHGLAYSAGALDIDPGHDRALQLYAYYAHAVQREEEVTSRYLSYIQANPQGTMANDARWLLAASYEAAGQIENAIPVLEPLRLLGDAQAATKLSELYAQIGRPMPTVGPHEAQEAQESLAPVEPIAAVAVEPLPAALEEAHAFLSKGRRGDAFERYSEVLGMDPAQPEALSWVRDYLRAKRDHAALRDVLLAAARSPGAPAEARIDHLLEIAELCESHLRDAEGAIDAYSQLLAIDQNDEGAREALARLLEKVHRWDELASLLEQETRAEPDLEKRVGLEKRIAVLHEQKRRDPVAAAEAWERVANLSPQDEQATTTASNLFEQVGTIDRAARVIADNASSVADPLARGVLLERLGGLREQLRDPMGAGEAYAEAAEARGEDRLWEAAERAFALAERWARAGQSALQLGEMAGDERRQAAHFARASEHFARAGDEASVTATLGRATELDPTSSEYARRLGDLYAASGKWSDLAQLLTRRADRLTDKAERIAARREAAILWSSKLEDKETSRDAWLKVLEDGDDKEALQRLIEDAMERQDPSEATLLLHRLGKVATDRTEQAAIALREAEILAEGLGDVEAAIERYEYVLEALDPACRPALQAVADLQEARDEPEAAANALERELKMVSEPAERAPIAARLARLYEQLGEPANAIRSLEIVRAADPEDFDALARLYDLCEKTKQWDKAAELLAQRIEVEADEADTGLLTRQLARILADELDRGDEALAALTELADLGNESVRTAYVELGDRLGWRGIVATKLVEWWLEAKSSAERTASLRGAFERFIEVGREQDAVHVACEIVRSKGADHELAERLEKLSIGTHNLDALAIAHDLLAGALTGIDRARELARQAETRVKAGASPSEALQHAESGLMGITPAESEELLARLAALAEQPGEVVDLYERQIARCKAPMDRVRALARAAQVAASHDQSARVRGFFDLALGGSPGPDALAILETAARDSDTASKDARVRRALCAAMAAGGQGARDGGRTRGSLMRRAAALAYDDLGDIEQAFTWLGDALIAHVDPLTLDALDSLSHEVGNPRRAEATLSRALDEVFDGPLVRQLLARRAKLRRDELDDAHGAAADLKKLHELSPTDQTVADDLSALLSELGDYPAMVQLYEDLILRGKDVTVRTDLARKVARMWEAQLADPREAADAWRRVLRMKPGDPEATAGLERAKSNMLRRREASERPLEEPPASSKSTASPASDAMASSPDDQPVDAVPADRVASDPSARVATLEDVPTESQPVPAAVAQALSATASGATGQADSPAESEAGDEEIVMMADELAEVIDLDDEPAKRLAEAAPKPTAAPPAERRKRTVPPPLPRE